MDSIPETDKIDLAYLKSEAIGQVITKGLAELYKVKPQFPIEYFAKWLLNYNKKEGNRSSMQEHLQRKEALKQEMEEEHKVQEEEAERQRQLQDAENLKELEFQTKIKEELFHEKLLVQEFCNHLKERGFTGVYIGYVDYPTKSIAENDIEENAHIDLEGQKLIKYIGANDDHSFMIGKTIPLTETGVTGDVFREIPPPEEGQQPQSPVVYIPDATKEQRLIYFKWKKLGAFLAIPLIYQSCLSSNSLDAGIEERIRFRKAAAEKVQEKETKINEFNTRIKEAQDTEQDPTPISEELEQFLSSWQEEEEAPFQSVKRQFVVCVDTLGQDREINQDDRQYCEQYTQLFAESWEAAERKLLSNDIEFAIQYAQSEHGTSKDRAERLNEEEERALNEKISQFDELKEKEKEYSHAQLGVRISEVCKQIKDSQQELFDLTKVRVLKYPGILLALLLFLGYKKETLLEQGTNYLDWSGIKHYIGDDLIQKISEYEYKGSKPEEIPNYAKINSIRKRIIKYTVEQVEEYNLCYSKILKWLQYITKVRELDIKIRREYVEKIKELKQQNIEIVIKMKEEKEKAFEELKAQQQEDAEPINREEWERQYDIEHPEPVDPPETPEEIDNDYDDE